MTLEMTRPDYFLGLVDKNTGTVDRSIFSDQEIYELELERVFARAWNFVCHDSQIPNSGDFFMTFIGEDRVIVVRDNDGLPQVLLNTCRHRGNAVCRAEEGHASSFMCTYHGWTFDLQGKLVGVPGFKEVYHEELDRGSWGLITAAKVDSYKGFIFATMDQDAIDLDEYLGDVGRIGLNLMAERGNMAVVPGIQKYTIPCNWKFAADNVWDFYHARLSHASASMSGYNRGGLNLNSGNDLLRPNQVILGEYGHAIGGPKNTDESRANRRAVTGVDDDSWRERPEAKRELGPVGIAQGGHPNIFPNMWLTTNQVSLRLPKGPMLTEIWWFTMLDQDADKDVMEDRRQRAGHTFGPAGMLEQDDGENWGQSTRAMQGTISQRFPLHYAMGHGHDEVIDDEGGPPHVASPVNEHPQFWLYRSWSEWMASSNWAELKSNHSEVPKDFV